MAKDCDPDPAQGENPVFKLAQQAGKNDLGDIGNGGIDKTDQQGVQAGAPCGSHVRAFFGTRTVFT